MSRFRVLALLLMSACGDNNDLISDAATPDPDTSRSFISLRYLAPPEVADHARVYFQATDGDVVSATSTDRSGRASAVMNEPGTVTAVIKRANSYFIYTYLGVQPGDEVIVDERASQGVLSQRTFRLRIPAATNATIYNLSTSCGSENVGGAVGASMVVGLAGNLTDCPDHLDLLVMAFGDDIKYLFTPAVAVAEGAFVTMTGAYRPNDDVTVEVVTGTSLDTFVRVAVSVIGGENAMTGDTVETVVAGSATTMLQLPAPPGSIQQIEASAPSSQSGIPHAITWGPATLSAKIDLGAGMPHPYLSSPVYDADHHALVWTESAEGVLADGVLARFGWAADGNNYQWAIQGRRTEEPTFKLPRLPAAQFQPRGTLIQPFVFVNIATDRGYAGIGQRLITWMPGQSWPVDAPTGDVRYVELGTIFLPDD